MKTRDLFQDEPLVVKLFKKLMADKQRVFFRNRAGKETEVKHLSVGVSTSGKPAWWFYHEPNTGTNQPVTWKTGDAINKLSLKKDGDRWVLFDRTVNTVQKARTNTQETP